MHLPGDPPWLAGIPKACVKATLALKVSMSWSPGTEALSTELGSLPLSEPASPATQQWACSLYHSHGPLWDFPSGLSRASPRLSRAQVFRQKQAGTGLHVSTPALEPLSPHRQSRGIWTSYFSFHVYPLFLARKFMGPF